MGGRGVITGLADGRGGMTRGAEVGGRGTIFVEQARPAINRLLMARLIQKLWILIEVLLSIIHSKATTIINNLKVSFEG